MSAFENFADAIRDSGALTPGQTRELQDHLRPRFPSPSALGRALLERGWMTAYQLNQVNRGRGARLAVGPYLLLKRLGRGNMGEVLKARYRWLNRLTALKLIRADRLGKRDAVSRFLREMEASARLDH